MIANLADLDGFVQSVVLQAFDHKSLNEDVAAFQETVPTTENLCIEILQTAEGFFARQAGARVRLKRRATIVLNMREKKSRMVPSRAQPKRSYGEQAR